MAGRPHMEPDDASWGCKCLYWFLLNYQILADRALQQQRLLWKMRPQLHYLSHLISETLATNLNPVHMSNFLDEDNMKCLRGVAHPCHPGKVLTSWAKRYLPQEVPLAATVRVPAALKNSRCSDPLRAIPRVSGGLNGCKYCSFGFLMIFIL